MNDGRLNSLKHAPRAKSTVADIERERERERERKRENNPQPFSLKTFVLRLVGGNHASRFGPRPFGSRACRIYHAPKKIIIKLVVLEFGRAWNTFRYTISTKYQQEPSLDPGYVITNFLSFYAPFFNQMRHSHMYI